MRWHLVVPIAAGLAGCGRFGFDPVGGLDTDADGVRRSYSETIVADGPRTYYRLGERSGTTLRDTTGDGDAEVATEAGGLADLGRPGALPDDSDTAIRFLGDGITGPRVGWAELPSVWPTWAGDFTIEAFVRPVSLPPDGFDQAILVCENYLTNGFRTGWDRDVRLGIWTTQSGATSNLVASIAMTLGAWHHVAFTRRGATVEVFLDARSAGVVVFDYLVPDSTADCGFGSFHGMPSDTELDELAIYEVALSQDQLAAHVAAALP